MRARASRHPVLAVALAVTLAALVLTFPAPFPGHVVSATDVVGRVTPFSEHGLVDPKPAENAALSDAAEVFAPDRAWARDELRGGHLPIWNPHVFGGWPQLASQQAAALYPVNVLSLVLPADTAEALRVIALLLLAALGAYAFARTIGLRETPAAVAAAAYGLSSPMVLWALHPHADVHALLGWMLAAAEGAVAGRRWGVPALAVAVGLAALGGHPESVLLDGLLVAAWTVVSIARRPGGERGRALARAAGGAALGLASAAIVLLPFAELRGQSGVSERGGHPGPGLGALASLAFPDVWGRPDWNTFLTAPSNGSSYVERTAYVGVAPLLLAALGLLGRRDRRHWLFAGGAAAAVVLAYDVPGISSWVVGQWPLRLVNTGRAISVLAFCLALLAGLGLQALLDDPGLVRRRAARAVAVALGVVPLVWLVARFAPLGGASAALAWLPGAARPEDVGHAAASSGVRWVVAFAATAALVAALGTRRRAAGAAAGLAALVLVELAAGWQGWVPVLPTDEARLPATPAIRALQRAEGDGRTSGGTQVFDQIAYRPNIPVRFDLHDPRGRGVPTLERVRQAWQVMGVAAADNQILVDPASPASAKGLRLFATRAVLVSNGAAPPDARLAHRGRDGRVYLLRGTLPRAWVTCAWQPASRDAALRYVHDQPLATLQSRPAVEAADAPGTCDHPPRAARVVRDDATTVTLDVRGLGPGRLVLADAYYPGWRAEVDGRRVPIAAADIALRSVALPAGAETVTFRYRPASVRSGLAISTIAWLLIAGWLAVARRRARRAA